MTYRPMPHEEFDPWACIGPLPVWREKAACLDEDPELFFPAGTTGRALAQVEEAKAICSQCPVMDECLEWALEANEQHGVWGGRSEEERKKMKRRKGR